MGARWDTISDAPSFPCGLSIYVAANSLLYNLKSQTLSLQKALRKGKGVAIHPQACICPPSPSRAIVSIPQTLCEYWQVPAWELPTGTMELVVTGCLPDREGLSDGL